MTNYFFDTSALVKRYVSEAGSSWAAALTASRAGHRIFVSQITPIEIVSAVMEKVRNHVVTP